MPRIEPFHISGKPFGTKLLTDEQVKGIKEEYPYISNKDLCEKYGVKKDVITDLARHYSIKKDNSFRGWETNKEPVDLIMFDWFYPKTSNPQLQKIFGKSDHYIRALAKERGLKKYEDVLSAKHSKSKPRVLYSISGVHYESENMCLDDILYIIENYPTETTNHFIEKFKCTKSNIQSVANYYELSKDEETVKQRRKNILIERNKRLGRDVTPELIRKEALKYHSKREFSDKDPSLYTIANRMGIMEEVTKHMVNFSFSVPQIISRQITEYLFKQKCEYNTRRIIAPYELDVYFPNLKIAFEYDGKGWHQNDEIDKIQLCRDKDILLIKLFERSRKFKEDIQQHLIENLDSINQWCNTKITKADILFFDEPIDFPKLFTDDELYVLRNNDATYLLKNYYNLYQKYRRYNPDNIEFKKEWKDRVMWEEGEVLDIIKKYTSVTELLKEQPNAYLVITRRFRHLMPLYGKSVKKRVLFVNTGEEFESVSKASIATGIPREYISRVCRGERNHTRGKIFKYI